MDVSLCHHNLFLASLSQPLFYRAAVANLVTQKKRFPSSKIQIHATESFKEEPREGNKTTENTSIDLQLSLVKHFPQS